MHHSLSIIIIIRTVVGWFVCRSKRKKKTVKPLVCLVSFLKMATANEVAVANFQTLLRFATVSANGPSGVYMECALWLKQYIEQGTYIIFIIFRQLQLKTFSWLIMSACFSGTRKTNRLGKMDRHRT